MLKIVKCLKELPFADLMEVYKEGNEENGQALYPYLSKAQQLLQVEQDFYQYLKEGFFTQPEDCYCLWRADGSIVAALRLQSYGDGLLLEALETAPQFRRRGYAKVLVEGVLQQISYPRIYVHISKKNWASIALHESCGFRKIKDLAVYADGSVTHSASTYLYQK